MTLLSDQDLALALPVLTEARLNELWRNYHNDKDSKQWLRFGQYVFNVTGFETDASYNIHDAQLAYNNLASYVKHK